MTLSEIEPTFKFFEKMIQIKKFKNPKITSLKTGLKVSLKLLN
jgi:hypothetical protein